MVKIKIFAVKIMDNYSILGCLFEFID